MQPKVCLNATNGSENESFDGGNILVKLARVNVHEIGYFYFCLIFAHRECFNHA